jgi:phosphoesterase RecJ-like protein
MLSQVVSLIESGQRFAITSHVRPDGDGLGSSLAFMHILESLGKDVTVAMRDPVPHAYRQLPGANRVIQTARFDDLYDGVFVIECSDADRPGLYDLERQFLVNIDHHATTELFGNINWIDSTASAVGEMIYNLCKAMGVKVTPEIAKCIYAALLTDTGSFHFSNTTERTFKVARELVGYGANPAEIARALFYNQPFCKVKLMGLVLSTLQCDVSGRIAWIVMTQEMMRHAGACEDDCDGIVNYPLAIGDVDVVAFFKEVAPGRYRISLRSKGGVNVAKLANCFGGGGHRNASGCTVEGALPEVERQVIEKLQHALGLMPVMIAS